MTVEGVTLRPYAPEDAEACAAIFARAWTAGHPDEPRVPDRAAFARAMEGRAVLVAADLGGRVLGFAGLHEAAVFVHHLYVDPDAAGRGIGRALLAEAVRRLGGRASLKCRLSNARALAFYAREGWRRGEEGETDGRPWVRLHSPD